MAEYIDREAVLNLVDKGFLVSNGNYCKVKKLISDIPAADVQPVKHGEWSQIKILQDGYKAKECSACKATFWDLYRWNYCPNCGAKMDGAE